MSSFDRTLPERADAPAPPPAWTAVAWRALPVAAAVGIYGISYGVLAVAAGLSPLVATLTSLLVCAGGSQFAFVGVLAAGGSPVAGAASGLLLNLRFVAFGLSLAPHLRPRPGRLGRFADAQMVVDETVALTLAGPRDHTRRRYRILGVVLVSTWVVTTAVGAYGGAQFGDLDAWGIDVAFPAGFLALLAPWLRSRQGRVAALSGVAIALALTPVLPAGLPVVVAAAGALIAVRFVRPAADAPAAGPAGPEQP